MQKVAVITGASSGLGKAIAQYYKDSEFTVFGIQSSTYKGDNITHSITEDLNTVEGAFSAIDKIKEKTGTINVLVNNAGVFYCPPTEEDFDMVGVNFFAPFALIKVLDDIGMFVQGSHIINIASVAGIIGDMETPLYAAMKAAIINMTKSYAIKFAPHIRVNCISPGFFNTNLVEGPTPADLIESVPMQREAEPEEIVPVVDMLQNSPYMTGANIVIDGGLSL